MEYGAALLDIIYLVGGVTFILGLKRMSSPKTAYGGNLISAAGMTLVVLATIIFLIGKGRAQEHLGTNVLLLVLSIGAGSVAGWLGAMKVKMTAMPQMVSLFNGMGGLCAALIGVHEYPHFAEEGKPLALVTACAGVIIGGTSFSGSIIAFLKLNGNLKKDVRFQGQILLNFLILAVSIAIAVWMVASPGKGAWVLSREWLLLLFALIYGIAMVLPIGGADMPVVISLLNSFTGVAAGLGGFLYNNMAMITGGILVGSAGLLLTFLMCEAMNRSLWNVLIGGLGSTTATAFDTAGKSVKEIAIADAAILLNYSRKVVFVPGYGMAVAQAHFVIHELEELLESRGVDVCYAIHPVAGRMPGHMNVLLAEAQVPYEKLKEMEEINPDFEKTDCVVVVGANDVVNPAAVHEPSSPLYGMPILEVYKAKKVIIIKRSLRSGYAGVDNPLFYYDNAYMLFGDAKEALTALLEEIKKL